MAEEPAVKGRLRVTFCRWRSTPPVRKRLSHDTTTSSLQLHQAGGHRHCCTSHPGLVLDIPLWHPFHLFTILRKERESSFKTHAGTTFPRPTRIRGYIPSTCYPLWHLTPPPYTCTWKKRIHLLPGSRNLI